MAENKLMSFFKSSIVVISSLILLIFFAGFLLFVSVVIYEVITKPNRERNTIAVNEVSEAGAEEVKIWIDSRGLVKGHNIQLLAARRDKPRSGGAYSSSYSSSDPVVNYLFLNTKTGEHQWLFNHQNFLIPTLGALGNKETVNAYLVQVVKKDTNGNGGLDASDDRYLMLVEPDGSGLRPLKDGNDEPLVVQELFASSLIEGGDAAFITYQQKGKIYYQKFDKENREIKQISGWQ